jgi:hypothetical protein
MLASCYYRRFRVHCGEIQPAALLRAEVVDNCWLLQRKEKVSLKGKGDDITTFLVKTIASLHRRSFPLYNNSIFKIIIINIIIVDDDDKIQFRSMMMMMVTTTTTVISTNDTEDNGKNTTQSKKKITLYFAKTCNHGKRKLITIC